MVKVMVPGVQLFGGDVLGLRLMFAGVQLFGRDEVSHQQCKSLVLRQSGHTPAHPQRPQDPFQGHRPSHQRGRRRGGGGRRDFGRGRPGG